MPSSLISSVALAGSGNIGAFFPEHLVAEGLKTTVLTRAGGNASSKSFPPEVTVKEVDYSSPESLVDALSGIDVVISTLSALAFDAQAELIKAAAKAGVKLFVPSEFAGVSTTPNPDAHPALPPKHLAHQQLVEAGLPALLVWTGVFPEMYFNPYFGFDFAGGKVTIYGSGRTPISWTTRNDSARFTAHYLASLSALPPVGQPATLRLEGSRASSLDVVDTFRRLYPSRTVDVENLPLEEGEKAAKDVEGGLLPSLLAYVRVTVEKGLCTVDELGKAQLSNDEWADWKPQTVEDVLKKHEGADWKPQKVEE